MAFLIDAAARRHFELLDPMANGGIGHARFARAVAAAKAACEIVAALMVIAGIMVALALLEMWIWLPHLTR
jgi:hypothetical protein